jgi:hypothetical protein
MGAFGRLGDLFGLIGALVCLVSGLYRLTGRFHMGGVSATSVFEVGVGLMVFACLLKLTAHERGHHS